MDYSESKERIFRFFKENDFEKHLINNERYACKEVVHVCSNGTVISILFPGYKSTFTKTGIHFDYRVDIAKEQFQTSLSHVNIIVDIYNKCKKNEFNPLNMVKLLQEVAIACEENLNEMSVRYDYPPKDPPDLELLNSISIPHKKMNKYFNRTGSKWDLEIEELLASMHWIVLQEDINYPISKGFEGRRMPFCRYLEAVYCASHEDHSIDEVIERALMHKRPKMWREIDYSFINEIR